MNRSNWAVFGFCLLGLFNAACANGLSGSSGASGNSGATSSSAATSTNATQSGSSTSLYITQFYPAAGVYASMPVQVQVYFSETNLNSSTAGSSNYYSYTCSGEVFTPTSVSESNGVATVYLPTIGGLPSNAICTLTVSSSILDTNGNQLTGTTSASYSMSGSSTTTTGGGTTDPTITSFTPASGTYQTMPSSVEVLFNDPTMSATTVSNIYNWLINCGTSGTFYPNNVELSGSTAIVNFPTAVVSLTSGTCTLTASAGLENNAGYFLSGGMTSTYALTNSASSTYNPNNNEYSQTPTVGGSGGSSFAEDGPSGYSLAGFEVTWGASGGTYVDAITAVWGTNAGNAYNTQSGEPHGGGGYYETMLTCPGDPTSRVVGLYGRSGSYVDQLGLICEEQDEASSGVEYSSTVGGDGGNPYSIMCPAGTYVVSISGSAGIYLNEIQLGCK